MNRRQVFSITFFIILLLLFWQLILIFSPFFTPILWAVILATVAYPLYFRLLGVMKGRETLSAALMTFAVVSMAVLPVVYLIFLAVQESIAAYEGASAWFKAGGLKEFAVAFSQLPGVGKIGQEMFGRLIVSNSSQVETSLLEGGKVVSAFLIAQGTGLAKNAFLLATDFFVMLFTLFFLFRDGHRLYCGLHKATPLEEAHKEKIFDRLNGTIGAVVRGTLLTALAQGITAGLAYWILGVPFPVFLGALSGLLSLFPFGGTAMVWVPVALYLMLTVSIVKAIIMVAIGVGLVGLMDNFLQPFLIGSHARLPVLFLFFASLGGLAYFGFLGLFLGPVLLAALLELFQIYQEEFQGEKPDIIMS